MTSSEHRHAVVMHDTRKSFTVIKYTLKSFLLTDFALMSLSWIVEKP